MIQVYCMSEFSIKQYQNEKEKIIHYKGTEKKIKKCKALSGRNVIRLPDLNGYENWNKKTVELEKGLSEISIVVSSLIQNCSSKTNKMKG